MSNSGKKSVDHMLTDAIDTWKYMHKELVDNGDLSVTIYLGVYPNYTIKMAFGRKGADEPFVATRFINGWDMQDARFGATPYVIGILNEMLEEVDKLYNKNKEEKEMEIEFARREDNDVRLKMAKAAVVCWYNTHNGPTTICMDDVYIVWFSKTLQNWKALAGTHHGDGMYYEITFDGDKDCAYVDAYKKWDNTPMTADLLIEAIKK